MSISSLMILIPWRCNLAISLPLTPPYPIYQQVWRFPPKIHLVSVPFISPSRLRAGVREEDTRMCLPI